MTELIIDKLQISDAERVTTRDIERADKLQSTSSPLVTHMYTADPSAHVFNDRIYIYPSHDIETDQPLNDNGDHFDMRDYHVFSLDRPFGKITDHGCTLSVSDVQWAERQMWAPDATEKNGQFYLYYPSKNKNNIFHIGVAKSDKPEGPFIPEPNHIQGTFSIDPAVFKDDDKYYLYFGGLWGGQLQNWTDNQYTKDTYPQNDEPALCPKMALLNEDMISLSESPKDILILDENGAPLTAGDIKRRYFEGPWMHKYNDTYYLSYSTGESRQIVYATGKNPYGPFTYQGVVLKPVLGWTTHHSIVHFKGKWYLFYHDCSLSGGQTHLRNIKMVELIHDSEGRIQTIEPYLNN